MGCMKALATEMYASLQAIETYLVQAQACLDEGDTNEAQAYIKDALAEIKRQRAK